MSEKDRSKIHIPDEVLDSLLASCDPKELLSKGGLLSELTARLVERCLEGEMTSVGSRAGAVVRKDVPLAVSGVSPFVPV